jgi:NAD(P)H-hydrate epimerase
VRKIVTAAEMREIDRLTTERFAVPSLLLMESAARASANEAASLFSDAVARRNVLVLCGRGNNGGDGAATGRMLSLMLGAHVHVFLFGRVDDCKGDARVNFEIASRLGREGHIIFTECDTLRDWEHFLSSESNQPYDVIIDALFGTGLTRPLEGLHLEVVNFIQRVRDTNHLRKTPPIIISLDVPSGLNADSNEPIGPAVRADLTITFTAPKPANVMPPASHFNGRIVIADIGSPLSLVESAPSKLFLTEAADARAWLEATRYAPDSYKNTHGHALVIAGSRRMTGAAVLSANAAMCAGAGLVTIATSESAMPGVAARLMPEVMTAPLKEIETGSVSAEASEQLKRLLERATVVAIGPGLTHEFESTRRFVRETIEGRTTPCVIDADGLNALAPWPAELRGTKEAPLILTPHEGEMLRLLGATDRDALNERARVVVEFAAAHNLFVVLKGTRTLIATPEGSVFVNTTGNAGLGTAGSGDTLTGIITGFIAQEFATHAEEPDVRAAIVAAVYVAGLAGDLAAEALGMRTMVASDVRKYLSAAVRALDAEGEMP